MDTETENNTTPCNEEISFLQKLSSYKEEYLKLTNFCVELLEENKTMRNTVQILENRLKSETESNQIDTIINKQQTIIEFLKNKDDYGELRQKIESLESRIETDKSLHEEEIKTILEKNTNQANEIRELNETNDSNKVKLEQLQKKYDEKIRILEADNKNKADFINKLLRDKNQKRSAYQPLDEAFRPNKIAGKRKLFNSDSNPEDRIFSPCVTEDD